MRTLNKKNLYSQINVLFYNWLFKNSNQRVLVNRIFFFFLKTNDIEVTKINRNNDFKIFVYEEYYFKDKEKIYKFFLKYKKYFEILLINKNEILVYFNGRLFKIYFNKKKHEEVPYTIKYFIFFYKISFMYPSNSFINYALNRFNKLFYKYDQKLSFEDFKQLNLKKSLTDLELRESNLKLVNIDNNNENLNIGKILTIFKKNKNKTKLLKKSYFNKNLFKESLNSIIPTYSNKKYWLSSNYFLVSNIIKGFIFKKFSYEKQNKKNNFLNNVVNKTRTMNMSNDIKKVVNIGDLIVINNRPYSSRNRLLAMVGHILNGGKYFSFKYRNYFAKDYEKKILINVYAEIFNIYKYTSVIIDNLDTNYRQLFELRGIKIKNATLSSKKQKKNQAEFISQKQNKKFHFIEINNIFSLLPTLLTLFITKKKISCFYLNYKKKCKIFDHKKKLVHIINLFITILNPKILFVVEQ